MTVRSLLRLMLLLPVLLAACGDLPEPFLGNPGATARRLAVPVTPMLAVPPPARAALTDQGARDFADLLALSLVKEEVPALARAPQKNDWRLAITAGRENERIVPRYAIVDPAGKEQGAIDGASFAATLWATGSPALLNRAAEDAVPKILALMTSIRATRDRANPNSLLNRIPRVQVSEVVGAPGDGNQALTRLIRATLKEFGPLVQVTPENADFTVTGEVSVTPPAKGRQQVEIVWTVRRPGGSVSGKVSQLNTIVAGSLDQYWGDVAVAVTREAAEGINTVVERFAGREPNNAAPAGRPPMSGVPISVSPTRAPSAGAPSAGGASPGGFSPGGRTTAPAAKP